MLALFGSLLQSLQAFRQARIELRHANKASSSSFKDWWFAFTMDPRSDDPVDRAIKHLVNVSTLWFVIVLGAAASAIAAFMELK